MTRYTKPRSGYNVTSLLQVLGLSPPYRYRRTDCFWPKEPCARRRPALSMRCEPCELRRRKRATS